MATTSLTRFIFLIIIIVFLLYVGSFLVNLLTFSDMMKDCGMANGPCYGIKINLDLKKEKVDEYVECPNGKIGFIHTKDKKTPIVFKVKTDASLLWAYRLESDSCSNIPLKKMSGMQLDYHYKSVKFFNDSYSEPGVIYLTDDFDFKYFCLEPF